MVDYAKSKGYKWALFIDCDEFLSLNGRFNNAKEMFDWYEGFSAVAFQWVLFGDSGLQDDGRRDVITRFTQHQNTTNQHVKTAVNLK